MDATDGAPELDERTSCAACGRQVAGDRIQLLARREDLAFVELPCDACGTVSLGIYLGPADDTGAGRAVRAPIGVDDVLDMHLFLADWDGDLRTLVTPADPP